MYIPTYMCTMFSAFPLVTTDQLSTPHLPPTPPLGHWIPSIPSHIQNVFSPLIISSPRASVIFPFPLPVSISIQDCHSSHLWWKKISKISFDLISHTSYGQILCSPWWSTTLGGGTYTYCLQFLSWSLCSEALAPTIPSVINFQSSSCLICQQNWTKLIVLFSWEYILPFVSRTIVSFTPASQAALSSALLLVAPHLSNP